jgi:hypothetical protein
MMYIGINTSPAPINYHQGHDKPGVNYHAGQLLEKMRPQVEEILSVCAVRYGSVPGCMSQKLRASWAEELQKDPFGTATQRKFIRVLSSFLAVHKVVSMMESSTPEAPVMKTIIVRPTTPADTTDGYFGHYRKFTAYVEGETELRFGDTATMAAKNRRWDREDLTNATVIYLN